MNRAPYVCKLVVDRDDEFDPHDWHPPLDRRAAVRMLGLSALAAFTGCGAGSTASTGSSTTSGTTASTTALATSSSTATTGSSIMLTATVSPSAATGAIPFYNGSTTLGTATLSAGKASFAATFNSAGTETLKAVYAGDTTYSTSTSSSVSVTVSGLTACTATLEGEEGPYFVDDSATGYDRSNILSNIDGSNTQTGVPFSLTLYVYDAKNAARRCRACGWISGSATRLESTRPRVRSRPQA